MGTLRFSRTRTVFVPCPCLIVLGLLLAPMVGGSLVTSYRSLTVSMGKSTFLQPEDFVVLPPGDAPCRIKVSADEPIWSRAGKVSPEVFDCKFRANFVSYSHSGSPLLMEDKFQLTVYYFDGDGMVVDETITMSVRVSVDQSLETISFTSTDNYLKVEELSGQSAPINSSFLMFRFDFQSGSTCSVSYSGPSVLSPFPSGGIVEGRDGAPVGDIAMDCRQFLMEGFRYKHLGTSSPDLDYIPLTVEVENTRGEVRQERVFLEVRITLATENQSPAISISRTSGLRVHQFVALALDSDVLSASDPETPTGRLVFEVTTDMDPNESGFFINLQLNSKRVQSFTQESLGSRQIAYHPPTKVLTEEKEVEVEFIVRDDRFVSSAPGKLRILVVPTKTNGPRIALNGGLVVLEGGTRKITANDLQIVDPDNLHGVEVHVKGGLRHGALEVSGRHGVVFTVGDMESRLVTYRHDNSETTEDRLIVRVTDGRQGVRARIPITVLPVDDNSPYLLTHETLDVQAGGYARISNKYLNATDRDSKTSRIIYVMKSSPGSGEMVKKRWNLTRGFPVKRFTQEEINSGVIFYHNFGGDSTSDSVEFRLADENDPPNRSGKYTLEVTVKPANNLPPGPVEGSTRRLVVNETELGVIGPASLWYEDVEIPSYDVVYTITAQPHFKDTSLTSDAGHLVLNTESSTRTSDIRLSPAIRSFTQSDVKNRRVVYVPPVDDLGLTNRTARMTFAVSDGYGNSIVEQEMEFVVVPVNDQLPRVTTKTVKVVQGSSARLTPDVVAVEDPDTEISSVYLTIEVVPRYGQLTRDGATIGAKERFHLDDLAKSDFRYVHNSSEWLDDVIELSVSDGANRVMTSLKIDVEHVMSHRPQPVADLDNRLEVDEGGLVFIGPENLSATDNDTDPVLLNFLIMKSPEFGEIRRAGERVEQFSQADIIASRVTYVHTGAEIGRRSIVDTVTFTVLDQSPPPPAAETVPLIDLEVTVVPVDNTPPELIVGGPIVVVDGKPASVTSEIVSARDVDSPSENLLFVVVQTPMWGFLERSKANTRSGRSQTSRRISSFTVSDLEEGTIQYVPSNLSKGGPPSDSFFVYVTDGQNQSPLSQIEVAVLPPNVKIPDFEIGGVLVEEGGESQFQIRLGERSEEDPGETSGLQLSIASGPRNGELLLVKGSELPGGSGGGAIQELRFHDVSVADIEAGIRMVYRHDGSESTEDRFTLSLSDGIHVVKRTSVVNIVPVNDMKPELVRNIPLQVDFAGMKLITNSILKATDDDSPSTDVYFVLVTTPDKGVLQLEMTGKDDPLRSWKPMESGENFTQWLVDESRVRYVHTTELGDSSADRFLFRVTDGANFLSSAAFVIDINRSNPKNILLRNNRIRLKEGAIEVITTDQLSADDGSRLPKEIIYSLDWGPVRGTLELRDPDGKNNSTVKKFTQADILSRRLFYRNKVPGTTDSFAVTVSGTGTVPAVSATVDIDISPSIRSLPVLRVNVPLTVTQGKTSPITSANLVLASDLVTPDNLTYILVEGPNTGHLTVRGRPQQKSFTQLDVTSGHVTYTSTDREDRMTDYFLFNVSDGRHEGAYLVNGSIQRSPVFFNILVQPNLVTSARLVRIRVPERLVALGTPGSLRWGFVLSGDQLKAGNPGSDPGDVGFVVRDEPSHGTLEHADTSVPIRRRFSQREVDEGKVAFVLNEKPQATNDSFMFSVEERGRTVPSDLYRFVFKWSVLEFAHNQYTVCEDTGSVSIKVVRRGVSTNRATVTIRAKSLSARQGSDFIPTSDGTLTFEPGVTELFWTIKIVNDLQENEPNERFKVLLRNSNQAIIGRTNKAAVQLINLRNGRCAFDGAPLGRNDDDDDDDDDDNIRSRQEDNNDKIERSKFKAKGRNYDDDDDYDEIFDDDVIGDDDHLFDYSGPSLDKTGRGKVSAQVKGSRDQKQSKTRHVTFNRKWLDEEEEDDDDEEEEEENEPGNRWRFGNRKNSEKNVFKNSKKKSRTEHPLQKYRKGGKSSSSGRGRFRWPPEVERNGREGGRMGAPTATSTPTLTTTTQSNSGAFVPQECTRDTKGLLYFDLLSSKMHRCTGVQWEPWGWGAGDGYQYTALLKDAADTDEDGDDDDDDDDDDDLIQAPPAPRPPPPTSPPVSSNGRPSPSGGSDSSRKKSQKNSCRQGWKWYKGSCYRVGNDKVTWNDAEFECRRHGGHLATAQSKDQLQWMSKFVSNSNYWIGLSDRQSPGAWVYTSGVSSGAIYTNWRRSFPRVFDGRRGTGSCVLVRKNLDWVNKPCDTSKAKYICQQQTSENNRRRKQPQQRGKG